jgi:hypothetical protein
MLKKIIPAITVMMMIVFVSYGQKEDSEKYDAKKHAYHVKQFVWVTDKSGNEVECVIHGHVSNHKYYVRQMGSGRQGKVNDKFIRPMSEAEIESVKKAKSKK